MLCMAGPSSMTVIMIIRCKYNHLEDYIGVCQRLNLPLEHQVRNQDIEAEVPKEKPHVAFCGGTKL
ncbi:hypothetical protein BDZ94DRAFT_1246165 [Collybia nuda]|uniref:Uncharacterized protein n=1 Tax=Collybia nuda TaxID=64659 RepID=A0A9P5YEY7_9AGAR|nr:hypothetical protein BDZ94DRAFT_1246165 [Collybia nuda]